MGVVHKFNLTWVIIHSCGKPTGITLPFGDGEKKKNAHEKGHSSGMGDADDWIGLRENVGRKL